MYKLLFTFLFVSIAHFAHAQNGKNIENGKNIRTTNIGATTRVAPTQLKQPRFYIYWGYNRAYFTHSDIHVKGPDYDFTLYNVVGHDRPSKVNFNEYLHPEHILIPQYNWRFGWNFKQHWAVSVGHDHLKYVMDRYQKATISGIITKKASQKWAGSYLNQPIDVTPDFLLFEHTDGFNLLSIDLEYTSKNLLKRSRFPVFWNSGVGGLWVVPRSDVRVFSAGLNNRFHLAGYALSAKTGMEIHLKRRFFMRLQARVGYSILPDVLIANDEPQRIEHQLGFAEWFLVGGWRF
jgi:hypothetical protein